jgi:hypothetical protein
LDESPGCPQKERRDEESGGLASILGGAEERLGNRAKLREANPWLQHMVLGVGSLHDGSSDPIGIKTRPVPGLQGCSYLTKERVTSSLSYVFGPLVEELKSIGYVEGKTLFAQTYDWRLILHLLEERDRVFTNMASVRMTCL